MRGNDGAVCRETSRRRGRADAFLVRAGAAERSRLRGEIGGVYLGEEELSAIGEQSRMQRCGDEHDVWFLGHFEGEPWNLNCFWKEGLLQTDLKQASGLKGEA